MGTGLSIAATEPGQPRTGTGSRRSRVLAGKVVRLLSGFLFVLVAWQVAVLAMGVSHVLFPWPADVAAAAIDLLDRGILYDYTKASLSRYVLGVLVGTLVGLALGLLVASNRTFERMLSPAINFLYAIVDVAWIPLFIIWWGYGMNVILAALVYVVAFPVLYNTIQGVKSLPRVYTQAALSLGATYTQRLWHVVLPGILPQVLTGFRVGAGFAFRALIFAEMVAAQDGLGYLIFSSTAQQQTDRTMVGMIAMGLIWLAIDRFYLRPLESASVERWGTVNRRGGGSD